jgi:hypothetical protein
MRCEVRFCQCCCWRFKNSVIRLLDGCVVPVVQEACSGCINRVKLATRVAVLHTSTALFSNRLILKPLQPFAISGTTHHMKQHHITKDLSVHYSSVMLNVTVSCAMAHVICHWPVTTETWVQFQARFMCTKWHSERFFLQVLQFSRVSYHLTPSTHSIHILFIFDCCCMLTW